MRPSQLELMSTVLDHVRVILVAGRPLPEGLKSLAQSAPVAQRDTLNGIAADLEQGQTLSASLTARLPELSTFAATLLAAGETSGDLRAAVDSLLEFNRAQRRLNAKVRAATVYPRLVLFGLAAVILPVLGWCLQGYDDLWASLGYRMPTLVDLLHSRNPLDWLDVYTRIVLSPFQLGWPVWLAVGLMAYFMLLQPLPSFKALSARMIGSIYLVGPALGHVRAAGFCSALGILLRGLVPLDRSLGLLSGMAEDTYSQQQFAKLQSRIAGGTPLSEALAANDFLPPSLPWFVALGERSGELDRSLLEAARYYGGEAEFMLDFLAQTVEPLLLVLLALFLAPIAASLVSSVTRQLGVF